MPRRGQRRSKGEGSIYRTTVRSRAGQRIVWRAELQFTDPAGRVRRRSTQHGKESEARDSLRNWQRQLLQFGTLARIRAQRGPTFTEYADAWLSRRKPEISSNTYRQYESNMRLRLKPHFSGPLKLLSTADVSDFLAEFKTAREKPRAGETGATTLRQCLALLKQILADAVAEGLIEKIPFPTVGRRRVKVRVERKEMHVLDAAQQRAVLNACTGDRLRALWMLALATGMREGELLGLRWAHIQDDHIVVQRRLDARTREGAQTKSRAGVRRVEIDPATMAQIHAHRDCMAREGHGTGLRDLVFQNEVGRPISASNLIKRVFKPLLTRAGLPTVVRIHDLRHSHATLLLSSGVNPKVVQERLGHESVRTTLDLYGHVLPTSQREAATLTGRALFGQNSLTSNLIARKSRAA